MKTKSDIIEELRSLSKRMISCGTAMHYYKTFETHVAGHGREMVKAGKIAAEWADEWEKESEWP